METKRQSNSPKSFVTEQVERLAHRFSSLPWDKVLRDEYERKVRELTEKYGPERTRRAVTAVIDHEPFLEPFKLEEHIPSIGGRRLTCRRCAETNGYIEGRATDDQGREYRCMQSCKHEQAI